MSKASAIIRAPGGRRTKWAVLVFWLVIVAVTGPLAGKLTGAEKNDASAWLPGQRRVDQGAGRAVAFQSPEHLRRRSWSTTGRSGLTGAPTGPRSPPTPGGSPASPASCTAR